MTTTSPESAPAVLVPVADPLFTVAERQALAGFLSGYSGLTRGAYTLDLRQYTAWCTLHGLHLFAAKRVDIESFRGDMEAAGRARGRSPAGSARSPGSIGTPWRRSCSTTNPRRTSNHRAGRQHRRDRLPHPAPRPAGGSARGPRSNPVHAAGDDVTASCSGASSASGGSNSQSAMTCATSAQFELVFQ
jgi:hypothetical protein